MSKTLATRADILSTIDRKPVKVDIPAWGAAVYLRPLTVSQRSEVAAALAYYKKHDGDRDFPGHYLGDCKANVAVDSICGPDGDQLFTREDAGELLEKNAEAIETIFERAMEISGIGGPAEEADTGEKAVDALENPPSSGSVSA